METAVVVAQTDHSGVTDTMRCVYCSLCMYWELSIKHICILMLEMYLFDVNSDLNVCVTPNLFLMMRTSQIVTLLFVIKRHVYGCAQSISKVHSDTFSSCKMYQNCVYWYSRIQILYRNTPFPQKNQKKTRTTTTVRLNKLLVCGQVRSSQNFHTRSLCPVKVICFNVKNLCSKTIF